MTLLRRTLEPEKHMLHIFDVAVEGEMDKKQSGTFRHVDEPTFVWTLNKVRSFAHGKVAAVNCALFHQDIALGQFYQTGEMHKTLFPLFLGDKYLPDELQYGLAHLLIDKMALMPRQRSVGLAKKPTFHVIHFLLECAQQQTSVSKPSADIRYRMWKECPTPYVCSQMIMSFEVTSKTQGPGTMNVALCLGDSVIIVGYGLPQYPEDSTSLQKSQEFWWLEGTLAGFDPGDMLEPEKGEFPSAKAAGVWLCPYKQSRYVMETRYQEESGNISRANFKVSEPTHEPEHQNCLLYIPLLAAAFSDRKNVPGSVVIILKDYKMSRSRLSGKERSRDQEELRSDQEKLAIFNQFFEVSTNEHGPVSDRSVRQKRKKQRTKSETHVTQNIDFDSLAEEQKNSRQAKNAKRPKMSILSKKDPEPEPTDGKKSKGHKKSGKKSDQDHDSKMAIVAQEILISEKKAVLIFSEFQKLAPLAEVEAFADFCMEAATGKNTRYNAKCGTIYKEWVKLQRDTVFNFRVAGGCWFCCCWCCCWCCWRC